MGQHIGYDIFSHSRKFIPAKNIENAIRERWVTVISFKGFHYWLKLGRVSSKS